MSAAWQLIDGSYQDRRGGTHADQGTFGPIRYLKCRDYCHMSRVLITRRLIWGVSIAALVVAACGTDGDREAETTNPTSVETTTSHAMTTTHAAHDDDEHTATTTTLGEVSDGTRVVEVVMTEFAFEPETVQVSAGETIRFVITNDGAVAHEFRLSNPHRIEEHIAAGHEDHGEESGHHEEGGDVLIEIEPGETGELEMTFPEDTSLYTSIACLLPGHYEAGMAGDLTYAS